jgi:hypothetical protein
MRGEAYRAALSSTAFPSPGRRRDRDEVRTASG